MWGKKKKKKGLPHQCARGPTVLTFDCYLLLFFFILRGISKTNLVAVCGVTFAKLLGEMFMMHFHGYRVIFRDYEDIYKGFLKYIYIYISR